MGGGPHVRAHTDATSRCLMTGSHLTHALPYLLLLPQRRRLVHFTHVALLVYLHIYNNHHRRPTTSCGPSSCRPPRAATRRSSTTSSRWVGVVCVQVCGWVGVYVSVRRGGWLCRHRIPQAATDATHPSPNTHAGRRRRPARREDQPAHQGRPLI